MLLVFTSTKAGSNARITLDAVTCYSFVVSTSENEKRNSTQHSKHKCRLVNEGFSEADANKAMPYAAQALGIATACVGGVGIAGSALMYASGVDLKESVRVSSARDAWTQMHAQSLGSAIGSRLRVLGEKVAAGLPPIDTSAAPKTNEPKAE